MFIQLLHFYLFFLQFNTKRKGWTKPLSDIVKIKKEKEWQSRRRRVNKEKRNEKEREMYGKQQKRKMRREYTEHIKRHRCTVGDYISDVNGNAGETSFSSVVNVIAFPSVVMDVRDRETQISHFTCLKFPAQSIVWERYWIFIPTIWRFINEFIKLLTKF